jgi:cysteine desulfurase
MSRPSAIYLDYASTSVPLDAEVSRAMQQGLDAGFLNPASQHEAGRGARKVLEWARENIAEMLGGKVEGMDADRFIFTSGGTEANNLALFGLAGRQPGRVIVSAIEHPSVAGAAEELARRGFQVDRIRVTSQGVVDLAHVRELLGQSPPPKLVSVMLANNETGVLQPVQQIAEWCASLGVAMHTDAVQVAGKQPIDLRTLGATALTVAPHKFYGPVGIGGLLLRTPAQIEPQLFGGHQQGGIRPGTESIPLALGFREALQQAAARFSHTEEVARLREYFEAELFARLGDLVMNGANAERVPHISNVAFLGIDRQQLFLALDFAGVYCSTGSACASGSSEPSPVLRAMGLDEAIVGSSLRFSFGAPTTLADIEQAIDRITLAVNALRARKSVRK